MAIHKLVKEDWEVDDFYSLIAIHCSLEDYRLAYLLNTVLNLKLKRKNKDLDFSEANYSIYEWEDKNQLITWNLVSNICKVEKNNKSDSDSLFNNQSVIVTTYNLIPESKRVNYFLKIDHQSEFYNEKKIVSTLLNVPQIVTAYKLETDHLKSKTNLIFN